MNCNYPSCMMGGQGCENERKCDAVDSTKIERTKIKCEPTLVCRVCKIPVEPYINCTKCGTHKRMFVDKDKPIGVTPDESSLPPPEAPLETKDDAAFEIWWATNERKYLRNCNLGRKQIARVAWMGSRGWKL